MVLLIIHILFVALAVYMKKKNFIKSEPVILIIAGFMPVTGVILIAVNEFNIKEGLQGSRTEEIYSANINYDEIRLMNRAYNSENDEITIPLEEALIMNDTALRRELMLNILRKNPEEYFNVLKKAQVSDDVEVAHYATSTMMGILTEYELQLRDCKNEFNNNSNNKKNTHKYIKTLLKYINSDLIQGKALENKRLELDNVLNSTKNCFTDKKYAYMNIVNKIKLKQYDIAIRLIDDAKKKWQDDEKLYMLELKCIREGKGKKSIKDILKEVKENEVYLSKEGKEWYSFWNI